MKVKFVTKIFVLFICTIIFASAAYAQDKCNLYSEPSIGVTFCAPQDWLIRKMENNPYAKLFGEKRNGLTPNINLQAESFPGSLSEFANASAEAVLKSKGTGGMTKIEMTGKSEFDADARGFKFVYDLEANGLKLKSVQYFFFNGLGDNKIIITATLPIADADVLEEVVDASVKTFKVTAKPAKGH